MRKYLDAYIAYETKDMSKEQWLEARKCGIGRSDATSVLGLNPYKSSVDDFDIDYGLEQKPLLVGDRGEVIGYYVVYHLEPSGYSFVFMTKDEVMEHGKKYSKSFEGGIWEKEFDLMAKKTVIKKLLKYALLSIEIQKRNC